MTARITDHALVRWLERAHGIDMDGFRNMLSAIADPYAKACVKHAEIGGLWFVFDGDVLITVVDAKPTLVNTIRNDRGGKNGTHVPTERMHWKGQQRKRDHR